MKDIGQIALVIVILAMIVWFFLPTATTTSKETSNTGDPFIDPDDSYQIGLLVGMTGGTIPDAATMRFALQRFQQAYGRRATSRDIGVVLGLINSSK